MLNLRKPTVNEEEEILYQMLHDHDLEDKLRANKKKYLLEKIEKCQAKKKLQKEEVQKSQKDIEKLASKIREYWEKITIYNKTEHIVFIVNMFPDRLNQEKVSAIFPKGYVDIPTEEEALEIAAKLLGVKNDE
jgi:predicted nucleotide-binding protein (sugar kinase/HSP70/actin superfamily)